MSSYLFKVPDCPWVVPGVQSHVQEAHGGNKRGSVLSSFLLFFSCPPVCHLGKMRMKGQLGGSGSGWQQWRTGTVVAVLPGGDRVCLTHHLPQCSELCPITPGWRVSDWRSGLMQCHAVLLPWRTSQWFSPFPLTVTSMNCTRSSVRPNPKTSHLGNHLVYCTEGLPLPGKP